MTHSTPAAGAAPARPFGRFACSSLVSAGVDLAAFELLCRVLEGPLEEKLAVLAATVLARALSGLVNYLINYFLVFHSRATYGRSAVLYTAITVGKTFLSGVLVAWLAPAVFFLPRVGVKAVVDTLLFFVNYLLQKAFVY